MIKRCMKVQRFFVRKKHGLTSNDWNVKKRMIFPQKTQTRMKVQKHMGAMK